MRRRSSFRLTLARGFPFIVRARTLRSPWKRALDTRMHGTSPPRINGSRIVRSAREKRYLASRLRTSRRILSRMCVRRRCVSRIRRQYNASSLKTLARFLASRNVQADAWVAKNYDRRCEMHEFHRWLHCQLLSLEWIEQTILYRVRLWTLILWKTCKLYIVWKIVEYKSIK